MSEVDIDALIGSRRSKRGWLVLVVVGVVVGAGVGAFLLLQPDEPDVAVEPERVEATTGQLSTTVDLSGSAVAERSTDLAFEASGTVASVVGENGSAVQAGDILATLDDSDAQRRIETAEVQLRLAQLRLEALLATPAGSEVAAARQSIESAESQVTSAEMSLAGLAEPPSAADLASAEQAVASALAQLSSAEETLAGLSEPPSASDVASSEQAVASALAQLSSAEETLTGLSEPPSAADLASAEQAVASALAQLSSAEEALAALRADPSDTEIAAARSAVAQAQAQLLSAVSEANDSWVALGEAWDDYCDEYGKFNIAEVTCAGTLPLEDSQVLEPLSDKEVEALHETLEGRSNDYQARANALINNNLAYILAEAGRQTAVTDLSTAEDRLEDLLLPASDDDVRQAELALEAARASRAAAAARLEVLLEEPTAQDFYQAEQAVEAARANNTAAVARLTELRDDPTAQDFYQAEQAVEAARANHSAAVARLEELQQPADESDHEQAQASLDTALAGLATARARYDELLAGATANAIAQQEESVRLAEISLEEARSDLADLAVVAPFGGIVGAVNVHPGDRVTQNIVAFSVSTPDRMLIDLTVTEADLLSLEVGQAGIASFDGVEGVEYPVRIVSISRIPDTAQGVVTYGVEARILAGAEIADVASQLAVLAGQGVAPGVAGVLESVAGIEDGDGAGAPGFGGGGLGRGGPGGPLAAIELPEGVTIQEVIQAVINGEPLPEGVNLPEGFEIPPQLRERLAAGGLGAPGRQGQTGVADPAAGRLLPAPGMSATVTILTEVREQSVLVPVSAVRQLDGEWFVTVPVASADGAGFERVTVGLGESDGVNVEVTSGLEAGAALLIGADSAGIAYSATFQQQEPQPGFGFFPGSPPGGFGGPGGGRP